MATLQEAIRETNLKGVMYIVSMEATHMERNLNHSNWGVRLGNLGYGLAMNVRDTFGRSWKFRASSFTGGPVAYFHSLADLARWVRQVEEVRLMVDFPGII